MCGDYVSQRGFTQSRRAADKDDPLHWPPQRIQFLSEFVLRFLLKFVKLFAVLEAVGAVLTLGPLRFLFRLGRFHLHFPVEDDFIPQFEPVQQRSVDILLAEEIQVVPRPVLLHP